MLFIAAFRIGIKKNNAKYEEAYHHCFLRIGKNASTKFFRLLVSGIIINSSTLIRRE
jgi:hypothetical protein